MKAAAILSLLPLLAQASAIGERDAEANAKPVNTNLEAQGNQLLGSMGNDQVDAAATCPPSFPLYCPRYGWCCPRYAVGCCPRSCCGPGTRYCGNDGNCYR
ncbi:hypothetical protein ISF_05991 [Cordyceps fumosorosea ARSEF 2679]|uniref:Granulin n=1 Tax=Cordyceps fumosorosea (strain ARSEF 2679) TaxID=1081104 RepID=A0A167SVY7_CORFA|nr:hypothetical protein ISF_05991 [Cordyceps fumosorosea ARSEF 2679]OAA59980.1 hypothetical protein ISF_05991 [Cordyceps fumosorosea ARSEF 2679]